MEKLLQVWQIWWHKSRWSWCIIFLWLLHLWSLMRYPAPFVDEIWNVSRAWSFLHTGRNFGQLDSGVFDHINGHWTFFPLFPTLLFSASLKWFAQPILWPLRLVALTTGAGLLGAVYAIAYRLQGRALALLSVMACGLSVPFIGMAHLARADTMVAALGFTAIALYLYNDRHRFGMGWLSGLCIGLAFEFHANAAIYAPALGLLYLHDSRLAFWRRPDFWGFVCGGLLGGVVYATIHILPYPQEYQAFMKLAFFASHAPPITTGNLETIGQSVLGTLFLIISFYPASIPLLFWSVVEFARQRTQLTRRWLVLMGALYGMFILLVSMKNFYYIILISPAMDIVLAYLALRFWHDAPWVQIPDGLQRIVLWTLCAVMMTVEDLPFAISLALVGGWGLSVILWPRKDLPKAALLLYGLCLSVSLLLLRPVTGLYTVILMPPLDLLLTALSLKIFSIPSVLYTKSYVRLVIFYAFFISGIVFAISLTAYNTEKDYRFTQERINQVVQPEDTIMAAQTYWLGLYEHPYYSWESLIYYQRYNPGTSVTDALAAFRPDIFIMDGHMRHFISDKDRIFYQALKIPASTLYAYLETHAKIIAQFDGGTYGDVVVYRFQW